jgi:thiamine-phosphate pyrophosphorylase
MLASPHDLRLQRLHGLYGIVGDEGPLEPTEWARALAGGGACAIQLRFKRSTPREALALARAVRAALPDALLIVDDRPDLAVLADADGVHVGDEDISPAQARAVVGPNRLVGVTARSSVGARDAIAGGADHLGVGPVFPSRTKPLDVPSLGLAGLRAVCRTTAPVPVVAVSGIDLGSIGDVAGAGAACAAVIAAVSGSGDPLDATRKLAAAFVAGRPEAWIPGGGRLCRPTGGGHGPEHSE